MSQLETATGTEKGQHPFPGTGSQTGATASDPEAVDSPVEPFKRYQDRIDREIIHRLSSHLPEWQNTDDGTDDGQEVMILDDGTDDGQEVMILDDGTGDGQEVMILDDGTDDGQEVMILDDGTGEERAHPLSAAVPLASLDLDRLASELSLGDCRRIIDQAQVLLESFYVHLPFKRALHGVDPIQKLNILRLRLAEAGAADAPTPLELHHEMTRIFASVCDRHTTYLLPSPLCEKMAFLGVKVEDFVDRAGQRRYLIAHAHGNLGRHCGGRDRESFLVPAAKRRQRLLEVVSWNGVPIRRAVELNSEHHGGSNVAARHARGLTRLTLRPLQSSLPPDEREVRIGYRVLEPAKRRDPTPDPEAKGRRVREAVLPWRVIDQPPVPAAEEACQTQAWGLDVEGDAVLQLSRLLFAGDGGGTGGRRVEDLFKAREAGGGRFGYLRIFSFNADSGEFVQEFLRQLRNLPQDGLILDLRSNCGGSIWAAERILQFLTPRPIQPARFQVRNTPAVRELCRLHSPSRLYPGLSLEPWLQSLEQAAHTGAEYSRAFQITSTASCNAIGQRYWGPVVLITDALSYSATDVFAAGFQDHDAGEIIGIDGRTGGGGANIFPHALLCDLAAASEARDRPLLEPLPQNLAMNVALRRAVRVGERAGMPLESFGVEPDHCYRMTYRDLVGDNEDLVAFAVDKLDSLPRRRLDATVAWSGDALELSALDVEGIDRLDACVDGRPCGSLDLETEAIELAGTGGQPSVLELRGYRHDRSPGDRHADVDRFLPGACQDRLVARRRLWIPDRPAH